jgi:hypothetical protein
MIAQIAQQSTVGSKEGHPSSIRLGLPVIGGTARRPDLRGQTPMIIGGTPTEDARLAKIPLRPGVSLPVYTEPSAHHELIGNGPVPEFIFSQPTDQEIGWSLAKRGGKADPKEQGERARNHVEKRRKKREEERIIGPGNPRPSRRTPK